MSSETLQALRARIIRLSPLSDEDWEAFAPLPEVYTLSRGALFAEAGKRSSWAAFVVRGAFRQYYTVDGEERSTYFFFEGDLLCDYLGCIRRQPAQLSIEALEEAELLRFPYAALEELYAQRPAWGAFGRRLAEYLAAGLEERLVSVLTQRPEERYAALLSGHRQRILERIPQQYIASYLGITPVSLSRIRGRKRSA